MVDWRALRLKNRGGEFICDLVEAAGGRFAAEPITLGGIVLRSFREPSALADKVRAGELLDAHELEAVKGEVRRSFGPGISGGVCRFLDQYAGGLA